MKMGFITSILDGWTYEEVIDIAAAYGFRCVEVASWPHEKANIKEETFQQFLAIIQRLQQEGAEDVMEK